jgi:hypothetical protein
MVVFQSEHLPRHLAGDYQHSAQHITPDNCILSFRTLGYSFIKLTKYISSHKQVSPSVSFPCIYYYSLEFFEQLLVERRWPCLHRTYRCLEQESN